MSGDSNLPKLWAAARAAWPEVSLSYESFAETMGHLHGEGLATTEAEAKEVYLACACAERDARAVAAFEEQFISAIPDMLRRMNLSAADTSEVQQVVRDRLLVGKGGTPRLKEYAGRGSLRGLLRVTATRVALDLLRRQQREVFDPEEDLLRLPVGGDDPELGAIKEQHRAEFRLAFQEALAKLSRRERTVMRLHYLDGVPLHRLATSYGVNRATVSRWLAAAKKQLLTSTRKILAKRLGLDQDGLASLVRIIQSRFEISLRRLLETQAD